MISKHNAKKKETSNQDVNHKIIETPQIKAVREKALQNINTKNKSPLLSEALYTKIAGNKTNISLKNFPSKLKDDKSVISWAKNDNEGILQVPLRGKQRSSNTFRLNKPLRKDAMVKKQNQNTADQKLTKTLEKRDENIGHQEIITRNAHDIEQHNKNQNVQKSCNQNSRKKKGKSFLKTNLAQERMQRLRTNLNVDKEKIKEMCNVDLIIKKSPQKLSRSSSNSNSLGSNVYKNIDTRLKRLHIRLLKDATYERNINTLKDDDSQTQQNDQTKKSNKTENTTKDKLIERGEQEVLYEEMDWEPMKDEEIALQVEVVRTQLCRENRIDETNCVSENAAELTQSNNTESHAKGPLYIVIDTNVFLSNLEIVEEAKDAVFKNYPRPFIVIPWTVICELDYFKDNGANNELSIKARKAISFIHKQFSSKHPRVIGQTREQAAKNQEDFSLNCPDDEILQCCLQISQLQKSVVLLSYDKNLCTKAMIYNILALGRHDPLEKIDDLDTDAAVNRLSDDPDERSIFVEESHLTDDIFEDTKLIMKNFLSTIITKQMSEIYGEAEWHVYVIIKPPWTTITALKCAIKHWIAAISESFQRRDAECLLKELLDTFEHTPAGGRKLRDMEYIIEKCSDLVQMVNTDKHYDLLTETFNAITELKKKCKKYFDNIDLKKLHDKIGIAKNSQEQETRAEKVFHCFQHIYTFARDLCGLACSNAGMAYSFTFDSANPSLSQACVQRLQSEITRKVIDLTQNLNKLLMQAENSITHQTLVNLQYNLNTFLPDTRDRIIFDVIPLDVYYCVKLKEEVLKTGLRQLQELTSHFCALAAHT
ncbi:PREDICTED: transcriptional protein SWT1 [Acromyrmex echinatior]|uniref:transcriptional protein SWT1 n=1 Tax=Acromyrmex echinatior TaxID=103372 RepID=UPI0005810000|nr:PREDICTED: transcriptional protein SWT1 [Acromyrmex echinatior]